MLVHSPEYQRSHLATSDHFHVNLWNPGSSRSQILSPAAVYDSPVLSLIMIKMVGTNEALPTDSKSAHNALLTRSMVSQSTFGLRAFIILGRRISQSRTIDNVGEIVARFSDEPVWVGSQR